MIKANSVSLAEARVMVDAMIDHATKEEPGLPMAFAVVDSAGVLLCFARMDGAAAAPRFMTENKAFTVVHCKGLGTSGDVGEFIKKDFSYDLACFVERGKLVPVEGGLPIKDTDGSIIGGIAASGRLGHEDVAVATAGLKAFEKMQ
ncbi:heme-binding protein [Chloroflexota bacterium]